MAAPTETYIDPADGAANGNDHGGNAFVDGVFNSGAPNQLTRVGAFTAATCQAGDKIYLDDNGSGEVTAGLYTISTRDSNDAVTLTADIRSGAPEPTDVRCDNHTGAVGLPWATVQHALDFTTQDAANGDRFNVKAGTDDVLAAALDFTTYGVPSAGLPVIFQGYTNAAGDGGIGGISGNASVAIVDGGALDYLKFIDMHLHNCGTNQIVHGDNGLYFLNVEFDNSSASRPIQGDVACMAINCYFHNLAGRACELGTGSVVVFCTFKNDGTNDLAPACRAGGEGVIFLFNVFDLDAASSAIYLFNPTTHAIGNTIYSNAGTGTGIEVAATATGNTILNNYVEGFSGVGGVGIEIPAGGDITLYGHNKCYNNTTNFDLSGTAVVNLGNNDVLAASGLIDPANDDFRAKPSLQALAWLDDNYPGLAIRSYLDVGALQRMSQMLTHPGMAGGARG